MEQEFLSGPALLVCRRVLSFRPSSGAGDVPAGSGHRMVPMVRNTLEHLPADSLAGRQQLTGQRIGISLGSVDGFVHRRSRGVALHEVNVQPDGHTGQIRGSDRITVEQPLMQFVLVRG